MSESFSKPQPPRTAEWSPFFEATARGVLSLPRCQSCGRFRFPPRPVCPECLATNFAWERVSGLGEVWSYVVMHQVYHPAFAAEVPYAVVLVRLVEGPKMLSRLLDVPPSDIRIGMPVVATFVPAGDGIYLPMFRLADSTES